MRLSEKMDKEKDHLEKKSGDDGNFKQNKTDFFEGENKGKQEHQFKHHDAEKVTSLDSEKNDHQEHHHQKQKVKEKLFTNTNIFLIVVAVILVIFNQVQVNGITGMSILAEGSSAGSVGDKDLSNLELSTLQSTAHTLAAVFPLEEVQSADEVMTIIFPTGTPDYGEALGVSYDDPVGSLAKMAGMYRGLKSEVQANNAEAWERYMSLASKPVGISCEYCCGLGAVGINKEGDSACGCQHNPALLTLALYLTTYTDYSDREILREVMRWKTLFFPKNMIELGTTVAGADSAALANLPGMVGGC